MKIITFWEIEEMRRFYAATCSSIMSALARIHTSIKVNDYHLGSDIRDENSDELLISEIENLQSHISDLGLLTSFELQFRLILKNIGCQSYSVVAGQIEMLHDLILDELTKSYYLAVDENDKSLIKQSGPVFGQAVADKFEDAAFDISEAAKCLALDRGTAAVFHLMRALEVALKSIAKCLGISRPSNPNWGAWLREIRKERLSRDNGWAEKDFFEDVYSRLAAIKDAYRNNAMHIDKTYTEGEAREIFSLSKGLFNRIASRMDQDGQPLA